MGSTSVQFFATRDEVFEYAESVAADRGLWVGTQNFPPISYDRAVDLRSPIVRSSNLVAIYLYLVDPCIALGEARKSTLSQASFGMPKIIGGDLIRGDFSAEWPDGDRDSEKMWRSVRRYLEKKLTSGGLVIDWRGNPSVAKNLKYTSGAYSLHRNGVRWRQTPDGLEYLPSLG